MTVSDVIPAQQRILWACNQLNLDDPQVSLVLDIFLDRVSNGMEQRDDEPHGPGLGRDGTYFQSSRRPPHCELSKIKPRIPAGKYNSFHIVG